MRKLFKNKKQKKMLDSRTLSREQLEELWKDPEVRFRAEHTQAIFNAMQQYLSLYSTRVEDLEVDFNVEPLNGTLEFKVSRATKEKEG